MSEKTFKELLEEINKSYTGTYVSVNFDEETNKNLLEYCKKYNLKPVDKFHATIVYSEDNLYLDEGEFEANGKVKPIGISYLGSEDNSDKALVILVESPYLKERFRYYTREHGYINKFDSYLQHISLSYEVDQNLSLESFELPTFDINISKEVIEPLQLD